MNYPSLEQYNQAFQHPEYSLSDPLLQKGKIAKTGLGLPLALCGGFALTYSLTIGTKKYAIRCFHKNSRNLDQRYNAISNLLKKLQSPYFVDFVFQPTGIRVNSTLYPIVKMAWAEGLTMGEFLENSYRDRKKISALRSSLRSLGLFLEKNNIAHGDIQPGNVMVSSTGGEIQLIDYDGMYVEELRSQGSSEIGHRNFQHPRRNEGVWDKTLDRFSLITINLSLLVLEEHPDYWRQTQSDGDSILFRANDFINPDQSATFKLVGQHSQLSEYINNFTAICKTEFKNIPTLEDFISGKNIPQVAISVSTSKVSSYYSQYKVLDAADYAHCIVYVGDRVELIGRVTEVSRKKTSYGKDYIFVNFGPWQGQIVKVAIWPEGLQKLSSPPDISWEGKWISVVGLLEPPYSNRRLGYTHLTINITQSNQMHIITESEAKYRLGGKSSTEPTQKTTSSVNNRQTIEELRKSWYSTPQNYSTANSPKSKNQSVLTDMKNNISPPSSLTISKPTTPPSRQTNKPSSYTASSKPKKVVFDYKLLIYLVIFLGLIALCILLYV